jgi:DNA-binding transcriptional MerR regulator
VSMGESANGGSHLSIGEVLSQLQEEFPDVTISKIRFLESQGLIDPERTPSGYRKFYAADVERLRWILAEQRDNFLPLKVIKERLDDHDPVAEGSLVPPRSAPAAPPAAPTSTSETGGTGETSAEPTPSETVRAAVVETTVLEVAVAHVQAQEEEIVSNADATDVPSTRRRVRDLTLPLVLDGEPAPDDDAPDTYDRVALANTAGVTEADLDELESFGLIKPFYDDGIRAFYDREALVCVRAAAVLAKHGIQPRHLKMYVHFTEREATLFHQVLAPFLRQRNPVSRARVDETIVDLVNEARALRGALLRRAIDDALGE